MYRSNGENTNQEGMQKVILEGIEASLSLYR